MLLYIPQKSSSELSPQSSSPSQTHCSTTHLPLLHWWYITSLQYCLPTTSTTQHNYNNRWAWWQYSILMKRINEWNGNITATIQQWVMHTFSKFTRTPKWPNPSHKCASNKKQAVHSKEYWLSKWLVLFSIHTDGEQVRTYAIFRPYP